MIEENREISSGFGLPSDSVAAPSEPHRTAGALERDFLDFFRLYIVACNVLFVPLIP